jgi:hypothetical protein
MLYDRNTITCIKNIVRERQRRQLSSHVVHLNPVKLVQVHWRVEIKRTNLVSSLGKVDRENRGTAAGIKYMAGMAETTLLQRPRIFPTLAWMKVRDILSVYQIVQFSQNPTITRQFQVA